MSISLLTSNNTINEMRLKVNEIALTLYGGISSTMDLIANTTITSSVTSINFTNIQNTSYNSYRIHINNIVPFSPTTLALAIGVNGSFKINNYNYKVDIRGTIDGFLYYGNAISAITIPLVGGTLLSTNITYGNNFIIEIPECSNTTSYKHIIFRGSYASNNNMYFINGAANYNSTEAIDSFRIENGPFTSGTIKLYGIK